MCLGGQTRYLIGRALKVQRDVNISWSGAWRKHLIHHKGNLKLDTSFSIEWQKRASKSKAVNASVHTSWYIANVNQSQSLLVHRSTALYYQLTLPTVNTVPVCHHFRSQDRTVDLGLLPGPHQTRAVLFSRKPAGRHPAAFLQTICELKVICDTLRSPLKRDCVYCPGAKCRSAGWLGIGSMQASGTHILRSWSSSDRSLCFEGPLTAV